MKSGIESENKSELNYGKFTPKGSEWRKRDLHVHDKNNNRMFHFSTKVIVLFFGSYSSSDFQYLPKPELELKFQNRKEDPPCLSNRILYPSSFRVTFSKENFSSGNSFCTACANSMRASGLSLPMAPKSESTGPLS